MTAPDLGPCRCGPDHEHADFPPYRCADCPCAGHRPDIRDTRSGAENPVDPQTWPGVITIPGGIDFRQQRATQAAQWVDQLAAGIRVDPAPPPDDPHALCDLADMIEQVRPDHIDPIDVIALLILRQRISSRVAYKLWRAAMSRLTRALRGPGPLCAEPCSQQRHREEFQE